MYTTQQRISFSQKLFALLFVIGFTGLSFGQTTVTFTTTGTWTVPAGVTSITVEGWGGGGGPDSDGTGSGASDESGGGGAWAKIDFSVTPGEVFNITIGAGGAATQDGGSSIVSSNLTSSILTVVGGEEWSGSSGASLGGQFSACSQTNGTSFSGFNGGDGINNSGSSGGGGGASGSPSGNGGDGSVTAAGVIAGGTNGTDGGNGGAGGTNNNDGNSGTVPGGGAGARGSSGSNTGVTGGDGQVRITYTPGNQGPPPVVTNPPGIPTPYVIQIGNTINFTWTATDPDGDNVISSTFDPGDGTGLITVTGSPGAGPFSASHTYNTAGTFNATVKALDDNSSAPAEGTTLFAVQVDDPNAPIQFNTKIAASSDDAEEELADGTTRLTSSDLEMTFDVGDYGDQVIGLRFTNVTVPKDASISNAYVQFTADGNRDTASSLTVHGEAIDDAPTFTSSNYDITSRTLTTVSVNWTPAAWSDDDRGTAQQTADISAIIAEITSRTNWVDGNDIVIIISGLNTGTRRAESKDGVVGEEPELFIEYNTNPLVDLAIQKSVSNSTPFIGDNVTFEIIASNTSLTVDAPSVIVTELLPSGYSYVGLDNTPVGTYDPVTGIWDIGALAANSSETLRFNATVNCIGSYINAARISDVGVLDINSGNDIALAGTVPQYGLQVCIVAVDDFSAAIPTTGGTAIVDVLVNDLINGSFVAPSAVNLSVVSSSAGLTLITTGVNKGQIDVTAGTAPGNLTVVYQICEVSDPTNCHTATARVYVSDLVDDYINQPVVDCQSPPDPSSEYGIELQYKTPSGTGNLIAVYSSPLMADIDNDGVVEIIGLSNNNISARADNPRFAEDIHIFNGQTGALKSTISTPRITYDGATAFAIADIDGDGFGEIIVATHNTEPTVADRNKLICFEHTGVRKWTSTATYGSAIKRNTPSVGIADFNQDGTPEIYVYNEIYNSVDGSKLVDGGTDGIGNSFDYYTSNQSITAAADLTTSPGLELAAGRTVYEITVNSGVWSMSPINLASSEFSVSIGAGGYDGFTGIADLDLDGQLDVIVAADEGSNTFIYAWNPRLASGSRMIDDIDLGASGRHGALFIGDVDGNGTPNIGICQSLKVNMLSFSGGQFVSKWTLVTTDQSGRTSITMFDFNQDGKQEIVYRDEDNLRIIDGSGSSAVNLATIPVTSTTGMEGPIVGDVDSDGAAEIVVANESSAGVTGRYDVYRSSLDPWAPARKVWNQYAFFNTHVNDDLSIPQFQANHGAQMFFDDQYCPTQYQDRPLNSFSVQSTIFSVNGCPSFPVADAAVEILSATLPCPSTTLTLTYQVHNFADEVAIQTDFAFSFYDGNPLAAGAVLLATETPLSTTILPGQSSGVLTVNLLNIAPNTKVFIVAGDDGSQSEAVGVPNPSPIEMPVTLTRECNYANNFAEVTTRCETLNPDINATLVNVPVPGDVSTNDDIPPGTIYGSGTGGSTAPDLKSSPIGSTATIAMAADGTYVFTGDTPGVYIYDVEVCVPTTTVPVCSFTKLTITVTDATILTNKPTAHTDIATTLQGVPVDLNTLANDFPSSTAASLNPASITIVTDTTGFYLTTGKIEVNSTTGDITFTPTSSFVGTAVYEYQVCEITLTSNCAIARQEITVLVAGSNAISAADDYNRTQQGNTITVAAADGLLANDESTTPGASIKVSLSSVGSTTIPGKGTFLIAQDGSYTFEPEVGFTGPVSIPYEACDEIACANATLYIIVDPFSTVPDFNVTYVNETVTGDVNTNDVLIAGSEYGTPVPIAGNPNSNIPTMNTDGTYSFVTPLIGVYEFDVPVCLAGQTPVSSCATELLTITVLDRDIETLPPVANTDVASTLEDIPVVLKTLANDKVGTLSASLVPSSVAIIDSTKPNTSTEGILSVNTTTGDITFDPVPGFTGVVSYSYTVCDDQGTPMCADAIQEVTVLPTDASNSTLAADDYGYGIGTTPITGDVSINDSDPEGDNQTVTTQDTTIPNVGQLVLLADGTFTFTAAFGFTGPVNFPYQVCDDGSPIACAEATLYILVGEQKTNPDINATFVNVPVPGDVNTNDNVLEGTTYGSTPTLTGSPAGSTPTITMNADGTYIFTGDVAGTYTYDVDVCAPGQTSGCPTELLTIIVNDENSSANGPFAHTDIATTGQDQNVTLSTLANDRPGVNGAELDSTSVTIVSPTLPVSIGVTTVDPVTGDITFDPHPDFTGIVSYVYQVCDLGSPTSYCDTAIQEITILPSGAENTTSAADDFVVTESGLAVSGNALDNDVDPEGNNQTAAVQDTTTPGVGQLVLLADGSFTFTPDPSFNGPVSFPYEVCDDGTPVACANATINILVKGSYITYPDVNTTYVNVEVDGDVSTNDQVEAGSTYSNPTISSQPGGSTPVITMNPDGTYSFTSDVVGQYVYNVDVCKPGQVSGCDTETLTITVLDADIIDNIPVANADIAITELNTPVTLKTLANDESGNPSTNLDTASVTVLTTIPVSIGSTTVNMSTGDITFTPAIGFTGMYTYDYQVCDNASPVNCANSTQTVTVLPEGSVNTTLAADDYGFTIGLTPLSGNVITNDTDAEGDLQMITTQDTTTPGVGQLVLNVDGTYTFTAAFGFSGPVNYPYQVCDDGTPQACAEATLYILVGEQETNPDINATFVNVPVPGDVNTNDNVIEGTTYSNPVNTDKPVGSTESITMNTDGTYTFTGDIAGTYIYDVDVCLPGQVSGCPTEVLTIVVNDDNSLVNGPFAHTDIATTGQDQNVTLSTLANDEPGNKGAGLDSTSVTIVSATLPSSTGVVTVDPTTGDITFDPHPNFVGIVSYEYQVCDTASPTPFCAIATQVITVLPTGAQNVTSAADDFVFTEVGIAATGNALDNDVDPEGDAQTVTAQDTTVAGVGQLVLLADGSFTFTPDPSFTGPVNFPYTVCDNGTPVACASATINILVGGDAKIKLFVYAYLEGPYTIARDQVLVQKMTTDLSANGATSILATSALSQPYNAAPWNYSGTESVDASFFATHTNIVDWVLIQLHDKNDSTVVLYQKACFLTSDGGILDIDGLVGVDVFAPADDYFISIVHRNHANVASLTTLPVAGGIATWDIRTSNSNVYVAGGVERGVKGIGSDFVLYGGDTDNDQTINSVDVNPIVANYFKTGYYLGDTYLDGTVNSIDPNIISLNYFLTISFY